MRVGKWVPIYKRKFPIPQRLAMAFGLAEGSTLHLVPITDEGARYKHGFEIIVSPVPPAFWRSVCRLSVRLLDVAGALAVATRFLSEKRINILFSESASTIARRAHWDAICDLSAMPEFAELAKMAHDKYARHMPLLLEDLSAELVQYMNSPGNDTAFPKLDYQHGAFTALTGLNNASFLCDFSSSERPCHYHAGGIEISEKLARKVSNECLLEAPQLPEYAMITGNTEQRYLRVLFLRDYQSLFKVVIGITTRDFAGGGIGIINQILTNLPAAVNLIRTSSRIVDGDGNTERGTIEIIAHWDEQIDRNAKQLYIEDRLRRLIPAMDLMDLNGGVHKNNLSVTSFDGPKTIYPRVFVSYSKRSSPSELTYLKNMLWDNHFRPVVGTDPAERSRRVGGKNDWNPSGDVVTDAFGAIKGCVALVSLLLEHPGFRLAGNDAEPRYVASPWVVAEEAYAWAHGIRVWRLRHEAVESAHFNNNLAGAAFRTEEQFRNVVDDVIEQLNAYRESAEYRSVSAEASQALYEPWFPPGDA
ncbi:MAG TPA: hypothetical protein VGR02_08475 [Thermoanaerobaculia bacterium]|jgi:hypothetical protein|nr:hypothetical protein [Thermoanaerobaculia bacterium]